LVKINKPWAKWRIAEEARCRQRHVVVPQALTRRRRLRDTPTRRWTFITNHAQVLLAVAQMPNVRVREIAAATDITERYAYRVLRDLEDAGYVERRRQGRCNLYRIHRELALGDPIVEEHSLWELLRLIDKSEGDEVVAMSASARRRIRRPGPSRLETLQQPRPVEKTPSDRSKT
jgi:DNA-binding MarR family transcriptional regulator